MQTTATATNNLRWVWFGILAMIGVLRVLDGVRSDEPRHLLFGAGMLLMALFVTRHDPLDRQHARTWRAMTGAQKVAFAAGLAGIVSCTAAIALRFL